MSKDIKDTPRSHFGDLVINWRPFQDDYVDRGVRRRNFNYEEEGDDNCEDGESFVERYCSGTDK